MKFDCKMMWSLTALAYVAYLTIALVWFLPVGGWDALVRYAPMADAFARGDWREAFHPRFCVLFQTLSGSVSWLFGISGLRGCQIVAVTFWIFSGPALWAVIRRIYDDETAFWSVCLLFVATEFFGLAGDGWRDDCRILPILLSVLGFQLFLGHRPDDGMRKGALTLGCALFLGVTLRVDCLPVAVVLLLAFAVLCVRRRRWLLPAVPAVFFVAGTLADSFMVFAYTGYFVPSPQCLKILEVLI